MRVGDMVRRKYGGWNAAKTKHKHGIVLGLTEKKCWRTHELGQKISWDAIEPEPHAEILINEYVLSIPTADLEVVHETS
jgi:hypothetical protein